MAITVLNPFHMILLHMWIKSSMREETSSMSWWIYGKRETMTADTELSYERSSRLTASKSTHGFITQPEHD